MTITLDLQPEIEQGLLSQDTARGVSLTEFVKEIVLREAHLAEAAPASPEPTGQTLIDAFAEISRRPHRFIKSCRAVGISPVSSSSGSTLSFLPHRVPKNIDLLRAKPSPPFADLNWPS